MRIVCNTIDELLTNLMIEPPTSVLQSTVHASTSERPIDSSSKYDAVKFGITFQVSAVVCLADGGQYILDYGEDCGIDYRDASQEMIGTARANALRKRLVEFCDDFGLRVRPGIIEA